MGSGCTSKTGKRSNCLNPISDQCVKYTGDAMPLLGICNGDWLDEVLASIVEELLSVLDGTGITLSDLKGNCQYVIDLLQGKDKNVANLIQILFDSQCTLKDLIQEVQAEIDESNTFSFDLMCLKDPAIDTKDKLIQALVNLSCSQQEAIDSLTEKVDNSISTGSVINTIASTLKSCNDGIKVTGSGESTKVNVIGVVPIRGCVFGDFDMSNFDSTGKGLCDKGTGNFAIANGLNGTINMMGRVASMADKGINGRVSAINGTHPIGSTAGEDNHKLTVSELPSHGHPVTATVNEEPHGHTVSYGHIGKGGSSASNLDENDPDGSKATSKTKTNLTVSVTAENTGGGGTHNNIQPTYYGVWIQRIS